MNHQEIGELLSAYGDGELTPAQREVVGLHLAGCPDCQRTLAEFRLTGQQLGLLADPYAVAWRPDVVEQVTARIRRRRRWLGLGRRLASSAASALAVGALVLVVVWLLHRLPAVPPEDNGSASAPVVVTDQPTRGIFKARGTFFEVTYITLEPSGSQARLDLWRVDPSHAAHPRNALQNLRFYLLMDHGTPAEDVFIVLERPNGTQTLLDPANAPSIPVPTDAQAGDRMRLFLWARGGDHSRVVEFTLSQDADENWLAVEPQELDVTPSLKVELPLPATPSSSYMTLVAPYDRFTLHLFGAELLRDAPAPGAVRNLGYRLSDAVGSASVVVELVSAGQITQQIALTPGEAPSIYLPSSARSGDRVRVFAATPYGEITPAAEFTLLLEALGWQAQDLHRADAPPMLQVQLPTPTPEVADLLTLPPPPPRRATPGPEVVLRLARVYVAPEQPRQGQPFTVTAVIRNEGEVEARAPAWIGAYRSREPYPVGGSHIYYLTIPSGGEAELNWDGEDQWEPSQDLSRENSRLTFRAGVNVVRPGLGLQPVLAPEADKLDNEAEITVDFLPYQPRVSDACPPGANLRLELGQGRVYQTDSRMSALRVAVYNDGNTEVVRVPLRASDAGGRQLLTYARWVPSCGGKVDLDVGVPADQLTYPVTVTLNPADAPDALPEDDRSDNEIVVSEYAACVGDTDLWLTADDVVVDGDDLLVTVHLSGGAPRRSFALRVYHTAGGRTLASEQVRSITCEEPLTVRFEGILAGLRGGFVLVQIDTEAYRLESVYPQHNNSATVPLP